MPATLLILIQSPIKAIWFVLFVLVLQQLDGNVIGPKILGNTTGLSSFWVLFSILLFGGLWGFVGMIVGVLIRLLAERVAIELLGDVHHLGKRLLTVFSDMSQCHIHHRSDSGTLYLMAQRLQRDTHKSLPPCVGLCQPFVLTIL